MTFSEQMKQKADEVNLQGKAKDFGDAVIEVERTPPMNQYACQITDFCASIAAGSLQFPAENGLANMRVLEQALRAAESRRHPL